VSVSRACTGSLSRAGRVSASTGSLTAAISASSSPGGRCPPWARTVIARSHSSAISRWDLASRALPRRVLKGEDGVGVRLAQRPHRVAAPGELLPAHRGQAAYPAGPARRRTRSTPPPATGGLLSCPSCQDDWRQRGCRHSVNHDFRAAAPTRRCSRPQAPSRLGAAHGRRGNSRRA